MDHDASTQGSPGEGFALPVHLARPLAAAARAPYPAALIRPLLAQHGFDGLTYIVARSGGASTQGEIAWSTHADDWRAQYAREGFAGVDPRLARTRHRVTPYLWDAADAPVPDPAAPFVRAAARHGIRSGVVVSLHDGATGRVVLTFDSTESPLAAVRRDAVLASLGELMLLAVALHEGVLSWRIGKAAARRHAAPRLTDRERECLCFAARGMTSADIGTKLCVSERTVNFHFGQLRRKLGALNRPEAIAKGLSLGIVVLD